MVMQTPFERILGELSRLAQREPLSAFVRIQEAYNKSLTEADVQHLVTFTANLGGNLGRWDDVLTFLTSLLDHSALPADSQVRGSIYRAQAVIARCKGDPVKAEECITAGVTSTSERCRVDVMTAQMLVRAGRPGDALPYLEQTTTLVKDLPGEDDLLDQVMIIGLNIARLAEGQVLGARAIMLAAAETAKTAGLRSDDWERQHQAYYQQGRARVVAGQPREALAEVQGMMRLEAEHQAGPTQRFFSALLACQAQLLRGQYRVATGALGACRGFLLGIEDEELRQQAEQQLADLDAVIAAG